MFGVPYTITMEISGMSIPYICTLGTYMYMHVNTTLKCVLHVRMFTIPKAIVATRHLILEEVLKNSLYVVDFVFCVRLAWYIPTACLSLDTDFRKV